KELEALAARVEVSALLEGLKALNERRAIADHPLSARLFIEDMLLTYAGLFGH
ncbi:MAG TPA: DNA polymerase III subunit delta', partial [Noviherbaspirillum sp.]